MTTYVQVIGNDCQFHSACVVIATENNRYLFEVGEGTQRLAVEHKVRIGKINGIFLTSFQPHSVGGLPGMLLTLDDAGIGNIKVYGPSKALQYLQSTKYFMRQLGQFHFYLLEDQQHSNPVFKTADITIFPIPLPPPSSTHAVLPSDCEQLSYVCETPKIPGKFFVEKAEALGIPKGPLFGRLKSGHSITLTNGTVVTPEQVLDEPILPKYIAIICRINQQQQQQLSVLALLLQHRHLQRLVVHFSSRNLNFYFSN